DYCFGKEEQLSTSLVNIVKNQNFDGVDIDYEYCYDVNGIQSGSCKQRTSLYSDAKAQTFLDTLTSKLRVKLDALQLSNGYNRGRYELTHAPMDTDISSPNSKYYQILKNRSNDLDFLMPQFYNGVTRPGVDGVGGTGAGSMSAANLFGNLANDLFAGKPNKVVFGFCISDCAEFNVDKDQAVRVLSDLKAYNEGMFSCNGGAFFWVALDDAGGVWSDTVLNEVSVTAGCSNPKPPTNLPTTMPPTNKPTTKQPTNKPTTKPPTTSTMPTTKPPTNKPTRPPTRKPTQLSTRSPTKLPTNKPTTRPPTNKPTTKPPTNKPTKKPPTKKPTPPPTSFPTLSPTYYWDDGYYDDGYYDDYYDDGYGY
ncbi:hypothetical protein ACHAW6_001942, partial [Cyclotella cf. meneghiniana]